VRSFSFGLLALTFVSPAFSNPLQEGRAAFDAGLYDQAEQYFVQGVSTGDAGSAYYLARMLELGLGVDQNQAAAVQLYALSAEDGHPQAQNRMALLYFTGGLGVVQNDQKAAELLKQAADQGDRNALFNLGKLHFEGRGVTEDMGKAQDLYKQAAAQDHILALNTLGALHDLGAKLPQDRQIARGYFARSAAYGNAVGLYESARLTLLSGEQHALNSEDLIEIHRLLNLATARGHPKATEALLQVTEQMTPQELTAAQGKARDFVAKTREVAQ
jgi:TPR repeat protein